MIKQLAHINIGAHDLKASADFYFNILGLEKTFEFIKDGELYGFYAGTGNLTFVEVFKQQETEELLKLPQRNYISAMVRKLVQPVSEMVKLAI